jgi:hypothetical protein
MIRDGGLGPQFAIMEKRVDCENGRQTDGRWEIVDRYREEGW